MPKLKLVLVTHAEKVLEVTCDQVTLPGSEGYLGILPGHTPLISTLDPGMVTYTEGGTDGHFVVAAGFCEVSNDVVTVLADDAWSPEQIDAAKVREALAEAQRAAADEKAGEEIALAQRAIRLAEAQLAAAEGKKH